MRGVTETTRGAVSRREESRVAKRNATPADLEQARHSIGKSIPVPGHPQATFTCVDVRLDRLHRLIVDLVREDVAPGAQEETDAGEGH